MERFYHLTSKKNSQSILKHGLKCNEEGYIYLMTTDEIYEPIFGVWVSLSDIISIDQVGLKKYCLYQVFPEGITSVIEEDNVGEFVSHFQRRVKQNIIGTEHLELKDERKVDYKSYIKYKFCKLKLLSLDKYNKLSKEEITDLYKTKELPLTFTKEMEDEMKSLYNL